jgi:hypothetical protein
MQSGINNNQQNTYIMKTKLILLFLLLGASSLLAQSTVGTDFWVTFLPNGDDEHSQWPMEPNLRITGEKPCSGTVTNPFTGWSVPFEITEGQTAIINIPLEQAYVQDTSDCILETTLHVTASDSVSVFIGDYRRASFDVSCALPVSSLGSDYLVQTYFIEGDQEGERSVLSVIAVTDNTTIDLLLNCDTKYGHHAYEPFSVTLQAGQCYQLQSAYHQNFSGSRVSVRDKKQKVAVFAGNRHLGVPYTSNLYLDHAQEQMMPTAALGGRFVVTQTCQRDSDRVRITALKDHCKIWKDGELLGIINAGQCFNFTITSNMPVSFLETSEPAIVGLYFEGCGSPNQSSIGDPSMVIINSLEQQVESASFCTFNTEISQTHFVNIVCETIHISGMMLDSTNIAAQFNTIPSHPEYSYARVQLTNGTHHLSNSIGGFVSHVYGHGHAESYSFSPASMVLTSQLMVNNDLELEHPDGFEAAINEILNFRLLLNYDLSEARWDFGDGNTAIVTNSWIQHSYETEGDFLLSCDIYRHGRQGQNVFAGRVNTIIHVQYDQIEEAHANGLKMAVAYPNPGSGTLNICTGLPNARLEVYDATGRLMHGQEITESGTAIYAESWPSGIYVWKVYSNNKEAETGKWVKE